jgi:hypothetical protein
MPMLNGCRWPACHVSSVGTYCSKHARLIRGVEAEREWATNRDEPMARERAGLYTAPSAQPETHPAHDCGRSAYFRRLTADLRAPLFIFDRPLMPSCRASAYRSVLVGSSRVRTALTFAARDFAVAMLGSTATRTLQTDRSALRSPLPRREGESLTFVE